VSTLHEAEDEDFTEQEDGNMNDETILLVVSVICLTIIQIMAICVLRIDGVLLSGTTASIVSLVWKRNEAIKRLRGVLNGSNEFDTRNRNRCGVTPTKRLGKQKIK
jgi:hypothetical protein